MDRKNTLKNYFSVLTPVGIWILTQIVALIILAFAAGAVLVNQGYSVEEINAFVNSNTMLVMLMSAVFNLAVFFFINEKSDEDIRLDFKEKPVNFIITLIMGVSIFMIVMGVIDAFNLLDLVPSYQKTVNALNSGSLGIRIITLCMLVPLSEELLFRGMMYNRLKTFQSTNVAMFSQALVFAILHMNPVQSTYAFISALIIVYIYEKTGNLSLPLMFHIGVNASNLLFEIPLLTKIGNMPIVMILVGIIIFGVLFRLFNREY